jgi:beta-xylosidase
MATLVFRDPVFDGASDPVVVRNRAEGSWWMLYTGRRATAPSRGVGWVHGTDIGVASSHDNGRSWSYRGTLDLEHEFGRNTFWAPEVIWAEGAYHMFVSYVRGVPETWAGHPRRVLHYVSDDLRTWEYRGALPLSSEYVIDAAVHPRPEGGYRLWYKDEADGSSTWAVDSDDLMTWHGPQVVLSTLGGHEGPNVFRLGDWYWLIVDSWRGQLVFRSSDLMSWTPIGTILGPETASPESCEDDQGPGLHADVVVCGDHGYVFYFTQTDVVGTRKTYRSRRSSILAAEVRVVQDELVCERHRAVQVCLSEGGD